MSEVANRAGVSRATVSRLLSGRPLDVRVTDETRTRVFDAVRELGYRPNRLAQSLNTRKKYIVGLSLPTFIPPDTTDRTWLSMHSTSVGELVCGVQSVAQPRGYDIHLFQRHEYRTDRPATPDGVNFDFIDGLIYATPDPAHDLYTVAYEAGVPMVMVGPNPSSLRVTSVSVDNQSAFFRLTRALLQKGHRRIGVILPLNRSNVLSSLRFRGYAAAHEAEGVELDDALVHCAGFVEGAGVLSARALLGLSPRPTAVIVGRTDLGLGFLEGIREMNARVPDDLEFVVYGDDHSFEAASPRISAVDIRRFALAAAASRLLFEELEGRAEPGRSVYEACTFVERESCALSTRWCDDADPEQPAGVQGPD